MRDGREIVMKKNGRVLAGQSSAGYYCFLSRIKGLCPWLVLIGLTLLRLVEDWFAAAVILKLNPSSPWEFYRGLQKKEDFNLCLILLSLAVKKLCSASAALWEGWGSDSFVSWKRGTSFLERLP